MPKISKVLSTSISRNRALLCVAALALAAPSWASIIGGDTNSIIGGDTRSIVGGDLNSIIGSDLAAIGAVESIDLRKGVVVVLGQVFAVDQNTRFSIAGRSVSNGTKLLKFVRIGDYVAVGGVRAKGAPARASSVVTLRTRYTDGATETYVKGDIASLNSAIGQLTIGSLTVDYTAVLSVVDASLFVVGGTVELAGIRPNSGGALLASSGRVLSSRSIIGGDTNSIIGGDTNSIIGGDTNSIIGGDTNSIIGGDTNSIIGGDTNSIIGGDTNSIIGGDTNSIIGGDTNSIIGGDTNSIIGGDTNSIIGGDTRSIIGGDTRSIIGGDTRSIIGGDTRSIIGGDTRSIIGGDTRSIIGGDTR